MENNSFNRFKLNKSLRIFFRNALWIALRNPKQAISFFRTIRWLKKAARLRENWKQKGYVIPPILMLSVTNECNLKCPGCYNKSFHDENNKELSDEKLWQIAEEAKELGISFFVIAGGEPLLRPVILEIMKQYPEIIFLVFTNGTLINDEITHIFKKQKNVVPLVSLEGNEQETDQRRGEGTFDKLIITLTKMKKKGIFFGLSLTLVRHNFETIASEEFIRKCYKLGCKFFLFLEYTPTQEGTDAWVLTPDQRAGMQTMMKAYRKKYSSLFIGVPWDEDNVGGCLSAGRGFVHINAIGDLEPCPFAPFSDTNIRDHTLKDALQSKLCEKIRKIPELSVEKGGGCVLWKEREMVMELMEEY